MKKIFLLIMVVAMSLFAENFKWPDGKKAAVCLTYDDGFASQLDIVVPLLDKHDFKGTFYLNGNAELLNLRLDEWRGIANNGHELGNHTLFHPCLEHSRGETRDWLRDETKMENYSLTHLMEELSIANTLLKAIDGKNVRSFAYTCCDQFIGDGIDFSKEIMEMFPSARGIGDIPKSMDEVDVYYVTSFACINQTGEELIAQVKQAEKNGTFVVFLMHGVGDSHLPITPEAHEQLVNYLAENRDTIWTDTFLNVFNHVRK